MKINHETFLVNLRDGEPSEEAAAPKKGNSIINASPETESLGDGTDDSEQFVFANVKVNAEVKKTTIGDVLKAIIDGLTALAISQGIERPVVKFEVVKDEAKEASGGLLRRTEYVSEVSVEEFLAEFKK